MNTFTTKFFIACTLLLSHLLLFSQSPEKISYQAVVRNSNNELVINKQIGIRISILQGSETGTPVFVETQSPTCNNNGLISMEIGTGTLLTDSLKNIDWANGPYFIKTETDPTSAGGTNYTIVGVSQFLSVPYALYAKSSGNQPLTLWFQDYDQDGCGDPNTSMYANSKPAGYVNNSLDCNDYYSSINPFAAEIVDYIDNNCNGIVDDIPSNGSYNTLTNKLTAGDGINIDNNNQITFQIPNQSTGDMLYFDGSVWKKVPAGTNGQILTMSGGVPGWKNQLAAPTVKTDTLTLVSIINGTVNPNGITTTVSFEYGTTTSYGNTISATQSTISGYNNISVSADLSRLDVGVIYHYRVKAVNALGTTYGNDMEFRAGWKIGNLYQGGILAYVLQPGDPGYDNGVIHGLVAAESDLSSNASWSNGSAISTGAIGTALGTGSANTDAIIATQGPGSYAASLCRNYNGGGYNYWYLPSKDELNKLFLNKEAIGGFSGTGYWTSSENDINQAWAQYFNSSYQNLYFKFLGQSVRAVHYF